MEDQAGIYCLYSNVSDKVYIGSSKFVNKRNKQHFKTLEKGNHRNPHLQSFYDKHGKDVLLFKVLEYCSESELLDKEQQYIDSIPKELRFNVADLVDRPPGTLGRIFTEEHRQNISKSLIGCKMPESHKEKSKERMLVNNPMSNPESRKRISDAQRETSVEDCKKIWELNQSKKYYPKGISELTGFSFMQIQTALKYASKYLYPGEEIYKVGTGSRKIKNKIPFETYFEVYSKNLSGIGRAKLSKEYDCSERQIDNIIKYCKNNPEAGEITYLPPISKKRGYTWNKGIPITEETRRKISNGVKGKKMPQSQIEATSKRMKGFKHTPETKKKFADSKMHFSPEECVEIYNKYKPYNYGRKQLAIEYNCTESEIRGAINYYNKYLT